MIQSLFHSQLSFTYNFQVWREGLHLRRGGSVDSFL